MIAQCDQCQSAFNIEDHLIPPGGRKFRCFKCKHIFQVMPPAPGAPEAAASPEPASRPDPPAARPPVPAVPASAPSAPAPSSPVSKPGPAAVQPPPKAAAQPAPPLARVEIQDEEEKSGITQVDFAEEALEHVDASGPRYAELGIIGEGGMGQIKLAKDTQLLRKVALKSLRPEAASPAALSYFFREAQITAQLDHPNIVPLYTVKPPAEGEKAPSFVMKLIKGKTLSDVIRESRELLKEKPKEELPQELSLNTRLGYFLKVCDGMVYAHRKEVIHRDLKPGNLMIGHYGEVYVMDWGIAKMVREIPETLYDIQKVAAQKSGVHLGDGEAGRIVGTPSYISPEQMQGLPDVGAASDQFSLGLILYELVTLKPARPGNMEKKMEWAREGKVNDLVHFLPEQAIAPELKAIIKKATAPKPHQRYGNVSALAEDLRRFLSNDETTVLPDNWLRSMWRWMNKHRHLTAIAVLAFFLMLSAMTIGSLAREKASLKEARFREKKLTYLMTKVASQAHHIDGQFMRLEELVVRLTSSAAYLLDQAPANKEAIYWQSDYNTPGKGPPDLAHSPLYDRDVSIDYTVAKTAPNVKREDVLPVLQKLAPMRYVFRKALLDSRGSFAPLDEVEARRLLTVHGVQVSWIFIGLESGVMFSYPGKGTYAEDYDPRTRPWYRSGHQKKEVRWGKYNDVQGLGQVLFCSTALFDGKGNDIGVVGMDVTIANIIKDSLTRSGSVGVVESYLLDDKGLIVIRSAQLGTALGSTPEDAAESLELFHEQDVVDRVRRGESGYTETERSKEARIVFFHEIPVLGWYYAEEVKAAAVLGGEQR